MFRQLVDQAKLSVSNATTKIMGRAGVGVAALVAIIFAIAALTAWLIQIFGAPAAYLIMAAAFTLIAVVAWLAESTLERRRARELHKAQIGTSAMVSSLVAAGPLAITGAAKIFRRNPTIVILALVLGGFMMRRASTPPQDGRDRA